MVYTLLTVVLILAIVLCFNFRSKFNREKNKISIKESMDLIKLPVVTFNEGDEKMNFLLDTGSMHSFVTEDAAKVLVGTPVGYAQFNCATGMGVSENLSQVIETHLEYKGQSFAVSLMVMDSIKDSFDSIKKEYGVQLHGILGSNFLKDHKYILDFAEMVAYNK